MTTMTAITTTTTTTTTKRSLRWNRFAGFALAFLQLVPSSLAQSDYEKCVATLIVSDTSKNSMLNKEPEYIMFLNVLTEFQYNFEAFGSLSSSLQMNFEIFQESDGVIDIRAATHGEEASPRQKRVVETFCTTTFAALSSLPTIARNATNIPNSTASIPPVQVSNETIFSAPSKNTTFAYPMDTETETELPETEMPETDMPETDSPMPSEAPTTAPPTSSQTATTAYTPELVEVSVTTTEIAPKVGSAANVTSTAKEAKPVTNVTDVTESSIEPPLPASTGNLSVVANATDTQAIATTATSHVTVVTRPPIQATAIANPPFQASVSPTTLAPTTLAPSTAPTASPTKVTTSSPTRTPTAAPTSIPTAPPTMSTPNETLTFTDYESSDLPSNEINMTTSPNVSPTSARTVSPANITLALVASPTASPTASPSALNETVRTNETDVATNTTNNERVTISPTEDAWAASSDDPYSDCKNVMKFSDVNEDGTLNKLEYVWFINDSWNNPYPGVAFKNLPQSLKDNFDNLANKGGIDISAVNSQEELSSEQEEFLNKICVDTEDAVAREEPNEDNVAEGANMDTFKDCLVSVALFDANRDTFLDENEYAALISQLSNGIIGKRGFGSLPLVLQDAFFALAISGSIDMRGAREGKELSSSQQEVLEEICVKLSYAMNEATQNLDGQENGTVVDYAETDAEAMLVYAACFMGMNRYDEDQDLNLDQEEYVKLVNHLGKNQFYNMSFEELHQVLQDIFWNLETDGAININGSGTDEFPDNEQRQFLGIVCSETTAAINMALEDVDPSEETPNPVDDVASSMDPIVIHSSFHIYSDVWIPEEEFETGETRENLEEAYKIFAADVVNGLVQEKQSSNRGLEEEQGEVDDEPSIVLDPESPSITKMIDLNCMSSGNKSVCKTVFAQYEIIPSGEMDRDAIYEEYVRVTQAFIDSGLLERDLDQVNPESLIAVIGASEPVVYTPPEATTNPAESIPLDSENDSDKETGNQRKKIISMSAVAFTCLLLLSVVALVYVRYRKRNGGSLSTSRNSSLRGSGSLGKSPSDTADDHDRSQTGGSQAGSGGSDGTPKSNIFRSRCGDTESDEDDMATRDEELGRMQVIDLCEGGSAPASNDYEDVNTGLLRGFGANSNGSTSAGSGAGFGLPPLRRKKDKGDELGSSASEEMSFSFRRYAMDGGKVNTQDEGDHTAVI